MCLQVVDQYSVYIQIILVVKVCYISTFFKLLFPLSILLKVYTSVSSSTITSNTCIEFIDVQYPHEKRQGQATRSWNDTVVQLHGHPLSLASQWIGKPLEIPKTKPNSPPKKRHIRKRRKLSPVDVSLSTRRPVMVPKMNTKEKQAPIRVNWSKPFLWMARPRSSLSCNLVVSIHWIAR